MYWSSNTIIEHAILESHFSLKWILVNNFRENYLSDADVILTYSCSKEHSYVVVILETTDGSDDQL